MPVRVYRAFSTHDLPETPEYAGCKSWVALGRDLDSSGEPVINDSSFASIAAEVERIVNG
jgi:hypothetical protein